MSIEPWDYHVRLDGQVWVEGKPFGKGPEDIPIECFEFSRGVLRALCNDHVLRECLDGSRMRDPRAWRGLNQPQDIQTRSFQFTSVDSVWVLGSDGYVHLDTGGGTFHRYNLPNGVSRVIQFMKWGAENLWILGDNGRIYHADVRGVPNEEAAWVSDYWNDMNGTTAKAFIAPTSISPSVHGQRCISVLTADNCVMQFRNDIVEEHAVEHGYSRTYSATEWRARARAPEGVVWTDFRIENAPYWEWGRVIVAAIDSEGRLWRSSGNNALEQSVHLIDGYKDLMTFMGPPTRPAW
jgi:hypothetical protein